MYAREVERLRKRMIAAMVHEDPHERVAAVREVAQDVRDFERRVVQEAKEAGLTWREIGEEYHIGRQAAHMRFGESPSTKKPPRG